jgi:tetratricopeptide (TPR) repeat protein
MRARATITAAVFVLASGGQVHGQRDDFFGALLDVQQAAAGTFGDEGVLIARRVSGLPERLQAWDRSLPEQPREGRDAQGRQALDGGPGLAALAAALLERGSAAAALSAIEDAARVAPTISSIHLTRGAILDRLGRPADAASAYLAAWRLEPDGAVGAYFALTRGEPDSGDAEAMRDTLARAQQNALRLGVPPGTPFPQTRPLADPGRPPEFPRAWYVEAYEHLISGRLEQGVARLREAALRDPLVSSPVVALESGGRGAALLQKGQIRGAVDAFEQAAAEAPASSEARRMLATAHRLAGQVEPAITHFEAALRLRADDERSWRALAQLYLDTGRLEEAARVLRAGTAAVPMAGDLHWTLADVLVQLEDTAGALAHYETAADLPVLAGADQLHRVIADLAFGQQDWERALRAASARVRAAPNDPIAHRTLAALHTKGGRQQSAFDELAVAAWLAPEDPLTLLALGQHHLAAGRTVEAREPLERAVQLDPELAEAHYALARALLRVGLAADARTHLTEFQRLQADASEKTRKRAEAAALRRTATTRHEAGAFEEAMESWRALIALEPSVAAHRLAASDTLIALGRLDEALQQLIEAADVDGVAEVHLRIAHVLSMLGRHRESALAWEAYEQLKLSDLRAIGR